MDKIEFAMRCRELNKEYKSLFGDFPDPKDYACTREEYIEALEQSIRNKCFIVNYLRLAAVLEVK